MATKKTKSRVRRAGRFQSTAKPSGSFHPRVVAAGPERFGIVAVDCAKARSKWMLADYYGRILVPPTEVEHTRQGFEEAVAHLRQAVETHGIRDIVAAVERTGAYHKPVQRALVPRRCLGTPTFRENPRFHELANPSPRVWTRA